MQDARRGCPDPDLVDVVKLDELDVVREQLGVNARARHGLRLISALVSQEVRFGTLRPGVGVVKDVDGGIKSTTAWS